MSDPPTVAVQPPAASTATVRHIAPARCIGTQRSSPQIADSVPGARRPGSNRGSGVHGSRSGQCSIQSPNASPTVGSSNAGARASSAAGVGTSSLSAFSSSGAVARASARLRVAAIPSGRPLASRVIRLSARIDGGRSTAASPSSWISHSQAVPARSSAPWISVRRWPARSASAVMIETLGVGISERTIVSSRAAERRGCASARPPPGTAARSRRTPARDGGGRPRRPAVRSSRPRRRSRWRRRR